MKVEFPRETNGVLVAIVVVVQGEEPAVAGVDTTCAVIVMGVLREVTEGGENSATDVEDSVVDTVEVGGGKNTPFWRGTGRIGFSALPTALPGPGKTVLKTAGAAVDVACPESS